MVKVENMTSNRGTTIANQFIIQTKEGLTFQSYSTIIAFKPHNKHDAFYDLHINRSLSDEGLTDYPTVYLDKNMWDYSVTTGRYRNIFLRETKKETEKKIKSGVYKLVNLN